MDWFDRAAEEIERDYAEGILTNAEYLEAMRDLEAEEKAHAEQHGPAGYDDEMRGW